MPRIIPTISPETYARERAICDRAHDIMVTLWPEHAKGGAIPEIVTSHSAWKACDNEMRGRVEQYELLHNPPDRISAYIHQTREQFTATNYAACRLFDVVVWTGRPIGTARITSSWPVNSFTGSRMYQFSARIAGRDYTGRGFGDGMFINLRETADSKRRRAA